MAIVEDDIRMQLAGYLKTKVFVSRPLNRGAGLDRLLATGPAPNLIVFDGTLPRHDVLSICRPREAGGLAIVITSFAFILGAVPLAVATGASTYSQRAIGTGVLGGMVSAMQLDEINHRSCRATSQRSLKNHRATSGT